MSSPKRLARIAGIFYLLVGIFGGFAEGFVDPKMYVANNAAQVTITLPTAPAVGELIEVSGVGAGGWKIRWRRKSVSAEFSVRAMRIDCAVRSASKVKSIARG